MYHPAAALHQGSLRATIEDDFKKIPATASCAQGEIRRGPAKPTRARMAAAPAPQAGTDEASSSVP